MNATEVLLATRTTTRLLDALHGSTNEPVWAQFDARYRPVICGFARRLGLNETDAEDVAQRTLAEFVSAYRGMRYDRTKGRLSSWLLGIAHHTTLEMFRRGRARIIGGDTVLSEVSDERGLRSLWSDERDRAILARAMSLLRDESSIDDRTLLAFELVGLRNVPATEAARQAGMTIEQVYVAKSRTTRRLRELVRELTDAFEEDT